LNRSDPTSPVSDGPHRSGSPQLWASSSVIERRYEPREPVVLAVHFARVSGKRDDHPQSAHSLDASGTGLFIASRFPMPRRTLLRLEVFPFDSSADPPVCGLAVVRWRRRWRHPRGMGVEFLRVSEPDRERLSDWLSPTR
jgi:hypothetical protein